MDRAIGPEERGSGELNRANGSSRPCLLVPFTADTAPSGVVDRGGGRWLAARQAVVWLTSEGRQHEPSDDTDATGSVGALGLFSLLSLHL